jgi:lysophospholipase L1-like esterase
MAILVLSSLTGCLGGGGGGGGAVGVVSGDSKADIQAANITIPQLNNWFDNGIEGKDIVFVGDSTTSHAIAMFSELNNFYVKEGEALYGMGAIRNLGSNGASLWAFLTDNIVYGITFSIFKDADLYILSYGINDVRKGQATEDQLVEMLREAVNRMRTALPHADFILRMPNSLLSTDVKELGYVQPNEYAQVYSEILRSAYLRLEGEWDNVIVFDSQAEIFGITALATSEYMSDQLHPSSAGYQLLAERIVEIIGQFTSFDKALSDLAVIQDPFEPFKIYTRVVEDPDYFEQIASGRWVTSSIVGADNGYIDLSWPGERAHEITCDHIVQMATNYVFALPDTCQVVQVGNHTRIFNLGSQLPPFTMTGGTIKVWNKL